MVSSLDVFALKSGEPKWVGCAETLAQAIELMRKEGGSGSYFVFSQQTGHKNFYETSAEGAISQVDASSKLNYSSSRDNKPGFGSSSSGGV
jgi:hypothetical protein